MERAKSFLEKGIKVKKALTSDTIICGASKELPKSFKSKEDIK